MAGDVVSDGRFETIAFIQCDSEGYAVNPDGTRGPKIIEPEDLTAVIFCDKDGNYDE